MREPVDAPRQETRRVPLWIVLSLVVLLAAIISTIMFLLAGGGTSLSLLGRFRDDSEPLLVINTRTPTPSPTATIARLRISAPTPVAAATATAFSTPTLTSATALAATATEAATPTPTAVPMLTQAPPTPAPMTTPHVVVIGNPARLRAGPGQGYGVTGYVRRGDALPLVARTESGEWLQVSAGGQLAWMLASLAQVQAGADPIPVASEIPPTPTATPLPAPVLIEPRAGASFGDKVRFKFSWVRRLRHDERVSIYVRSARGAKTFDWWVSEAEILAGGGAIRAQEGGFVYEVNSGLGSLPPGEAFWRVAVFVDTPTDKHPVSPLSQERQIYKK